MPNKACILKNFGFEICAQFQNRRLFVDMTQVHKKHSNEPKKNTKEKLDMSLLR